MRTHIKIPLLFLVVLLAANSVYADGWHMSDHALHLYEPNQKAVISWDGKTETMILASAVKSDDIANFAWVIPIQSSSKPEVSAGNISIFEDLIDYFKKEEQPSGRMLESQGVDILESKEIDVYDITILQATSSENLIDWLNNNGYQVPEEAKPVLDKYVAKGDFYFVANKIDLTNRFNVKLSLEEVGTYLNRVNDLKGKIIRDILCGVDYADSNANNEFSRENGLDEEAYNSIKEKYGDYNEVCRLFSDPITLWFVAIEGKGFACNFDEGVTIYGVCNSQTEIVYDAENTCHERIGLCSLFNYFKYDMEQIRNFFNTNIPTLKSKYEELDKIIFLEEKTLREYNDVLDGLRKGMSTPLKFEFQPHQPYYPLEISSLNLGGSTIEVYVLTNSQVTDQNDILKASESKKINPELRKKLEKHISLAQAEYVTRLSYSGDLNKLNADAEFQTQKPMVYKEMEQPKEEPVTYEEKYGFFQRAWNWISNLFG